MATTSADRGRITARVCASVQETLETAAGMVGATVNPFIVQTALREAERSIERERVIRLSAQNAATFLSALDSPLPPNANYVPPARKKSKSHPSSACSTCSAYNRA